MHSTSGRKIRACPQESQLHSYQRDLFAEMVMKNCRSQSSPGHIACEVLAVLTWASNSKFTIRYMTLGMPGITAGRMKGTGLVRLVLDNICWRAVYNCTIRLGSHGPSSGRPELAGVRMPQSFFLSCSSLLNPPLYYLVKCLFSVFTIQPKISR